MFSPAAIVNSTSSTTLVKSASLATINLNELTLLASALLSVTTTLVIASAIAASVDNAATEANFLLPALT